MINKDNINVLVAVATIIGFFTVVVMLCLREVPASSENVVMTMVGVLGTAFINVVSYYFGSSSGSAKKTDIMAKNGHSTPPGTGV